MQAETRALLIKPHTVLLVTLLLAVSLALAGCQSEDAAATTSLLGNEGESSQTESQPDGSAGQEANNTVTVSWTAPVERTDGSPILPSEIAGYEVHYGTESGEYTHVKRVEDGNATTEVEITGLGSGEYYFAVRVFDYQGLTSAYSEEESTTIN